MKKTYLTDEDGKPSFGRAMILLSVLLMTLAATAEYSASVLGVSSESSSEASVRFMEFGKYLFTTFMGWEARKRYNDGINSKTERRDELPELPSKVSQGQGEKR